LRTPAWRGRRRVRGGACRSCTGTESSRRTSPLALVWRWHSWARCFRILFPAPTCSVRTSVSRAVGHAARCFPHRWTRPFLLRRCPACPCEHKSVVRFGRRRRSQRKKEWRRSRQEGTREGQAQFQLGVPAPPLRPGHFLFGVCSFAFSARESRSGSRKS